MTMPTQKKYLDNEGLTELLDELGQHLKSKQNALVSGTSIKTVNNTSLLGSGNIDTNEFYKIPSEDCTAIFYATSGYIPNQTALNTACDNMLAAIRNGKIPIMKFSDGSADVWVAAQINYPESSDPNEQSPMSFTTLYGNYTTYTITAYKDYNTSNWVIQGIQTNLQSRLTFDSTPTTGGSNPVTSGGIKTALDGKQDLLVSGTNIKTINNQSLLGSGNIDIVNVDYDGTRNALIISDTLMSQIQTNLSGI